MIPPSQKLTREQQEAAWVADLLADAAHSEAQAQHGPFYPERGITMESLRAYAATCREQAQHPAKSLDEALKGQAVFR